MTHLDWNLILVYIHHHYPRRLWTKEWRYYRCHPLKAWRLLLKLNLPYGP
jgi:hypothetical protein